MGTLYQIKNLVNRSSVPTDPGDNMKAAEDFMQLVVRAHVVAAAKTIQDFGAASTLDGIAQSIESNYVLLPLLDAVPPTWEDKVHLYACEVLTLGLMWLGFYDAIREGDGNRILRYWRFFLIVFKSTNHPNYAKEAANNYVNAIYLFFLRTPKNGAAVV